MATVPKGSDRRVQKTRQVIRQAFIEIAREKGTMDATIQEITERANVSRGTFYAHFADKYELVDSIVRENFQHAVGMVPISSGWNREALQTLIQTILEYFKGIYKHHRRSRDITPLLEQAIHDEMNTVILALLKDQAPHTHIPLETISQIISWTIYGAAIQWSQKGVTISSEQLAQDVVAMIIDGVTRLGIRPNRQ